MNKTTPCLWFDGQAEQAEQAAELYTSIFDNSRIVSVNRCGEGGPGPVGSALTVEFELDGTSFIGLNGGPQFQFSEAISFQIPCETQQEVDHFWNGLSAGGEEGPCGWLKDRFGVSWQVVPTVLPRLLGDPDPEKSQRVMKAMYAMGKLDIAGLQRAAGGG